MAFHVACPFTCRKICYCTLGMPAPLRTKSGQKAFLQQAIDLQNLLSNPRLMLGGGPRYVEVFVPPLPHQSKKNLEEQADELLDDSGDDGLTKRAGTRRKATFSIVGVADGSARGSHSKKLEAAKYASRQHASKEALDNGWADRERAALPMRNGPDDEFSEGEHFESLVPQVMCGLCGCGEAIGSDKAGRMLSCQACRKQYHRKCIKDWAEHRDLFNWASWVCGSCRVCEVCTRSGEQNRLMFCKRCDHAYHASCLQPPLKHTPKGPFVCPEHVRCTSCNTNLPGGGVSSKWFLSYSLCDACGRLFKRGKYCPICLKVYRDSEPAPMVCCDVCEHWVHCECDGISDEKYEEYQVNSQLRYTCASCRGECYKVKDLDEAALEIWRRKDSKDVAQIADLRAAAGLPSQEEVLKACPSSDDEGRDREGDHVEESSKKTSKKKIKKVPIGTESLTKNNSCSKKVGIKDSSKSKSTPSKAEGTAGKLHFIPLALSSEKIDTPVKKSNKGSTASVGGDGAEGLRQSRDSKSTSGAEDKDLEDTKRTDSPPAIDIAVEVLKEEKKKSEGSREKGASTKKKRRSKAGELDSIKVDTPKEGKVKTKKLKVSGRQEIADRHDQTEAPSTTFEKLVHQGGSSAGKAKKERVSSKVAKKESDLELMSAMIKTAKREDAATGRASQIGGGDAQNSQRAQQSHPLRGSSPLHWVGHSDSVRRRRVPSSKYRDMDISTWRQGRTIKDPPSTHNPDSGSSHPTDERISQVSEATTPAQKNPAFPTVTDSRKERRRKPNEVEDNIDNDDSLEAPRKRLKVADLGEKKSDGQPLQTSPATGGPATRPLRFKFRRQPTRETATPAGSKDSKKSEEGEVAVKANQLSKKKRSITSQKIVGDPAQRRLVIGDAAGDDSWILQRLGVDAVSKRVEIFWPIDNIWYKGTIMAVLPEKLQFVVDYDDGDQETLNFGKEKVRLLSTTKRS